MSQRQIQLALGCVIAFFVGASVQLLTRADDPSPAVYRRRLSALAKAATATLA